MCRQQAPRARRNQPRCASPLPTTLTYLAVRFRAEAFSGRWKKNTKQVSPGRPRRARTSKKTTARQSAHTHAHTHTGTRQTGSCVLLAGSLIGLICDVHTRSTRENQEVEYMRHTAVAKSTQTKPWREAARVRQLPEPLRRASPSSLKQKPKKGENDARKHGRVPYEKQQRAARAHTQEEEKPPPAGRCLKLDRPKKTPQPARSYQPSARAAVKNKK